MFALDIPPYCPKVFPIEGRVQLKDRTSLRSIRRSRYSPQEKVQFFGLYSLSRSWQLASGYFTVNLQVHHDLLEQAHRDRWSINWADHFQHFFLKMMPTHLSFDASLLQSSDNRLHFYWNGQNWVYLYLWEASTQNFVEGISTADNILYFRQGQGTQVHHQCLARVQK